MIDFDANTGLQREVTLTFEALDGSSDTFTAPVTTAITITQAAGPPTITVGIVTNGGGSTITPAGTNYAVSSSAQTLTVPITLTGTAENVSYTPQTGTFLTVTALSPPSIGYEIVFGANTGLLRDVTLTFEALDGSSASFGTPVTTEITITQAAGDPTITVGIVTDGDGSTITPTGTNYAVSSSAQTLTVPITLTGTAENVDYFPQTGTFLTSVTALSPPSVGYEIVFGANTSSERDVTLTFEALDGSSASFSTPVRTEITITQAAGGEDHTLVSTPTYTPVLVSGNLTASGGDISIAFALGGGATGWEAVEVLTYVSLSPRNGDASTPVEVRYDANETFVARDVVITITTTGLTGISITEVLTFTQAGAQGIEVDTDPADVEDLSPALGSIAVDVRLFGSATGWDAAITNDIAGFLTLDVTSGVAGTDVLTIDYTQNTDLVLREGVVTLTATGGTGTAESVLLTISQLGTGPNVVVRAPTGEDFLALPAVGGTIVADVTRTGGATGWDAVAGSANPDGFLTVGTKDVANDTQTIDYAVNTGVSRTGTVTFTTEGGGSAAAVRTIDFRQLGAAPTIDVSTDAPDITMIPSSPAGGTGTITATITLGGGAEGWTATKSDDDRDLFISDFTSSGDGANLTLTITYNENTGVARSATLTIATTGGTGGPATVDLVLTQLAGPATITAVTMPASVPSIVAAGGTFKIAVTTGGDATGWSASVSVGDAFVSIDKTESGLPDPPNTITVTYAENTGANSRSGEITLVTTGGATVAETILSVSQLGTGAPGLTVVTDPVRVTNLARGGGDINVDVTLLGSATGWDATLSTNPEDFLTLSTTSGGGGPDVLVINYSANVRASTRTGIVTLTPTGSGGAGTDVPITISQEGTGIVLEVPAYLPSLRLYPNPAKTSFVIENQEENAHISIQHIHGEQLLRVSAQRGRNEVDIRHLQEGVYIVTLTTPQGSTSRRLIKVE